MVFQEKYPRNSRLLGSLATLILALFIFWNFLLILFYNFKISVLYHSKTKIHKQRLSWFLNRYCFKEAIGFEVKASFASRPLSRLIRWYTKLGDITNEFWEKAIRFHGTLHGLKITNWTDLISQIASIQTN